MFDLIPFERRQRNDLQRFFTEFEKNFFGIPDSFAGFRTDVVEKEGEFMLEAELPGFSKEDISLNIDNDRLVISAEHKEEQEVKEKDKNYVRRERSYGRFCRSFDLAGIKADAITAEYKNGVLFVALPKNEKLPPASRRIDIQ